MTMWQTSRPASSRTIRDYNPIADAAERHPTWTIAATNLHGIREVVCFDTKVVLIAETEVFLHAAARAVAHLDLSHHIQDCWFEPEAEELALWLAEIRLDGDRSSWERPRYPANPAISRPRSCREPASPSEP